MSCSSIKWSKSWKGTIPAINPTTHRIIMGDRQLNSADSQNKIEVTSLLFSHVRKDRQSKTHHRSQKTSRGEEETRKHSEILRKIFSSCHSQFSASKSQRFTSWQTKYEGKINENNSLSTTTIINGSYSTDRAKNKTSVWSLWVYYSWNVVD